MRLYKQNNDEANGGIVWEGIRSLTPEEEASYHQACEHLRVFEKTHDVILLVAGNLRDVQAEIKVFEGMVQQGPRMRADPRRRLNRAVVNYLTAARMYLDHRRTDLARRYGRHGGPFEAYGEARAKAATNSSCRRKPTRFLATLGMTW